MSAPNSEVAPDQHDAAEQHTAQEQHPVTEPRHDNTGTAEVDLKAGRRTVARSRGVLSGILLIILGAWAALVPFIGPYFDFGVEPRSGDAWHWTSGRGLYELLPGAVTVLAGIVLLLSASRVLTLLMSWLAALAGVWLVIGTTLDAVLDVGAGNPPGDSGTNKIVALTLLYFLATGAAITLVAGIALGRLSVHSVRDVRAAERRAEAEAAAEAQRLEAERRENERREAERQEYERREIERREHERREAERVEAERVEAERVAAGHHAGDTTDTTDTAAHDSVAAGAAAHDDHRGVDEPNQSDYDRGFAAGRQQAGGADPDRPTATLPTADGYDHGAGTGAPQQDDGYAVPRTDTYDAGTQPTQTGSHAVDPAAPPTQTAPPVHGTPPAPGGMDQYRYDTDPDQRR